MALTYTTVTWKPLDGAGQPLTGVTVTFAPTTDLTDLTDGSFISSEPFTVTQDGAGVITASLISTDNADLAPAGWMWQVTVTAGRRSVLSTVLVSHNSSPVDLDALLPAIA